MSYLIKILIIILLCSNNLYASENFDNKIIFNINNKVYTNIDLERRIEYIKRINNLELSYIKKNLDEVLNDYVSSLIFYEYNLKNKILKNDINDEIQNIYNNIILKNSKKIIEKKEIENLKYNIKIDLIRKKIIELYIKQQKNILNKKSDNLDLIYNYSFNYLIINKNEVNFNLIKEINNRDNFLNFIKFLEKNKYNFFFKEEDINDISIISKSLKDQLINNKKISIKTNKDFITIISLEKNLESYEGVFVKLINFNSKQILDKKYLNCNSIKNFNETTVFKEYEYSKLNNQIKNNLKSLNDYIIFENENGYNYIFMCDLRYDKSLLNSINLNKKIDTIAQKIEISFIEKYKRKYNFKYINE